MKKLLSLALLLLALALPLAAVQITRNTTLNDGQQLFASDLHKLIDTATVGPGFYSDQTAATILPIGYSFLMLDPGSGLYRSMTAQDVIYGNTNKWLNVAAGTSIPNYGQFLFYNPTNNTISKLSATNLAASVSANITVSVLSYANTNGTYYLSNWPGQFSGFQTNNHPEFLVWGTNGVPYQQSLSNLETTIATDLGTNRIWPFTFRQVFQPWTLYGTNGYGFTNVWGSQTNFAITNIYQFANTSNSTLTATDTIPVFANMQQTNTSVTLAALAFYVTNNNNPTFVSTNINIFGLSTNWSYPHGLSNTPALLRVVLVCVAPDAGSLYGIGDEVDALTASTSIYASSFGHVFGISCNSSNINITRNPISLICLANRTNGITYSPITTINNFRLKIYARPNL